MKRIGYTAVDGSQFCVHQVSLPLAPVMFNRCHQQLASVTCVATRVEMAILAPQGGQHLPDKTPCPTMKI